VGLFVEKYGFSFYRAILHCRKWSSNTDPINSVFLKIEATLDPDSSSPVSRYISSTAYLSFSTVDTLKT
jgi:hypothetical protein